MPKANLIWSAQETETVRKKCRVLGSLIGTLPKHPQQNTYLGLPWLLSMEEEAVISRGSSAEVAAVSAAESLLDASTENLCDAATSGITHEQNLRSLYLRAFECLADALLEKNSHRLKKRKRHLDARLPTATAANSENDVRVQAIHGNPVVEYMITVKNISVLEVGVDEETARDSTCLEKIDVPELFAEFYDAIMAISERNVPPPSIFSQMISFLQERLAIPGVHVHLPMSLDGDWGRLETAKDQPIAFDPRDSDQTRFATPHQLLLLRIYQSLHEITSIAGRKCGTFLTSGQKFGGDYCLYAGDPIRFHSLGIVHCLPWSSSGSLKSLESRDESRSAPSELTMMDIVKWGRLANVTKKVAVLASMDHHDKMVCFSVEWQSPDEY